MVVCIIINEGSILKIAALFSILLIVAVVGFEEPSYTVNETDLTAKVCVVVTNPLPNEELFFNILLEYTTRRVTAGKCYNLFLR